MWELGQDSTTKYYALVMKLITMSALEHHKSNSPKSQTACPLYNAAKEGVIPQTDIIWWYLWGYSENQMRKNLEEKPQDSKAKKKGNENRTQRVLGADLDAGSKFENNNHQFCES